MDHAQHAKHVTARPCGQPQRNPLLSSIMSYNGDGVCVCCKPRLRRGMVGEGGRERSSMGGPALSRILLLPSQEWTNGWPRPATRFQVRRPMQYAVSGRARPRVDRVEPTNARGPQPVGLGCMWIVYSKAGHDYRSYHREIVTSDRCRLNVIVR